MSGVLLIVDGDIGSCEDIVENLADIEQEILWAHDCGHALDIYMSRRPGYMLIDINLPDHDGISLAQMILGIDYKSIIFLMSDNPISLIRAGRQQLGIAAVMEKPLDFERLKTMLKPSQTMGLLW